MTKPDAKSDVQTAIRLLRAGELTRLDHHCRKSLEATPDEIELWKLWGVCLGSLGRDQDARRCFRAALEINPQDEWSLANYITSCFQAGDKESAFQVIDLFYTGLQASSQSLIVDTLIEGLTIGALTWDEIPRQIQRILGEAIRQSA